MMIKSILFYPGPHVLNATNSILQFKFGPDQTWNVYTFSVYIPKIHIVMNLCPVASSYYIATIFHNIVIQNITKSYLKISNF